MHTYVVHILYVRDSWVAPNTDLAKNFQDNIVAASVRDAYSQAFTKIMRYEKTHLIEVLEMSIKRGELYEQA